MVLVPWAIHYGRNNKLIFSALFLWVVEFCFCVGSWQNVAPVLLNNAKTSVKCDRYSSAATQCAEDLTFYLGTFAGHFAFVQLFLFR